MTVVILSFFILLIVVGAMSIGVLLGRKPIKGSCGGMSALGMGTACDICGGDQNKCEDEQQKNARTSGENLAYDATRKNSVRE